MKFPELSAIMRMGLIPWVKKVACEVRIPFPPTANCMILEFCARIAGGAVSGAALRLCPLVENVKEASTGDENRAAGVGAAGRDGQAVNRRQKAGIVVDLVAADDAITSGLRGDCSSDIDEADRITPDARRNA